MNVGERPPAPQDHVLQPPAARAFAEYMSEVCEHTDVRHGFPVPLGSLEFEGGVNFSLFSRDATRVRLEFFAAAEDSQPNRVVDLDPTRNRTGDIWHVWIKDIRPGQLYAYRVDGPHRPEAGQLFDFDRLLLDPCARAIKRPRARNMAPKCVFTRSLFDWRDDEPPRHPWSQTLIYETHVRGLTAHASSQAHFPGTFRGLTEKIPYLKDLGITAIELQPVDTATDLPVSGAQSQVPTGSSQRLESRSSAVLVAVPSDPCAVKAGGCDPAMDACAKAMGGDDPATAYAAAMLWYQGYPDPPHPAV